METGEELALLELDAELSTTEAARLLGMSRPTLIKLLDYEAIPSRREGRDRRVKLSDIVAYQQRRDLMSSARESFTRMAERHPEFFAGGVEADAEFDPSAMEPAG